MIIPAVYLKRITRTGFEDGCSPPGGDRLVLNQWPTQWLGLVAGPDFGTGSSREHAVWALADYGFRVVIGSRFGDIFRGNSGKAGLLIATVDQPVVEQLWAFIEAQPGVELTVDLRTRSITAGDQVFGFQIDDYTANRLLEGLDDIGSTLRHADEIAAFEARRPSFKPTTLPMRVAD